MQGCSGESRVVGQDLGWVEHTGAGKRLLSTTDDCRVGSSTRQLAVGARGALSVLRKLSALRPHGCALQSSLWRGCLMLFCMQRSHSLARLLCPPLTTDDLTSEIWSLKEQSQACL